MLCRFAILSAGAALLVLIYYSSAVAGAPVTGALQPAAQMLDSQSAGAAAVQRWEKSLRPQLVRQWTRELAPGPIRAAAETTASAGDRENGVALQLAVRNGIEPQGQWELLLPAGHVGRGPATLLLAAPGEDAVELTQSLLEAGYLVMRPATVAPASLTFAELFQRDRAAFAVLAGRREVDPGRVAVVGLDRRQPRALQLAALEPEVLCVADVCEAWADDSQGIQRLQELTALAAPRPAFVLNPEAGAGLGSRIYDAYGLQDLLRTKHDAANANLNQRLVAWVQDEL